VAFIVVFGLVFSLAATFVSMALLVRTSFGRVPHAISFLPAPLVLYNAWMSAWFVFECLRQFAMTAMTPPSALRLVAFVFLVASLLSVAFLYGCISVVHQSLGGKVTRRVRRGAKHLALLYGALLIVGWSAYHFNAESALFSRLRSPLSAAVFPLALASWVWLARGAARIAETAWRAKVRQLARRYIVLFSIVAVTGLARDRLEALGPAVPLVIDVSMVLAYTLVTVLWVESVQERGWQPAGSESRRT
jgi:hypothetical protein